MPQLSVEQNLFLGAEPRRHGFLDRKALRREAKRMLDRLGFALDPSERVQHLTRAQQQMVEIAKAFRTQPSVLILDEPTASLTERETQQLFALIQAATARGVGVIYITHRMSEIRRIGDRITVLRDGRLIDTVDAKTTSEDRLVELMTGRVISEIYPAIPHAARGPRAQGRGRDHRIAERAGAPPSRCVPARSWARGAGRLGQVGAGARLLRSGANCVRPRLARRRRGHRAAAARHAAEGLLLSSPRPPRRGSGDDALVPREHRAAGAAASRRCASAAFLSRSRRAGPDRPPDPAHQSAAGQARARRGALLRRQPAEGADRQEPDPAGAAVRVRRAHGRVWTWPRVPPSTASSASCAKAARRWC